MDFYKQAVEFQQQFANGKQITNAFQTNGIALNQQWADFFRENRFLIGLSIDGLSAVHNRYRISGNGNPTFEKVVKALELLKKNEVEFNTLTVVNDQNWQKGRETYQALKQLGSRYMQFIPIVERHPNIAEVTDFSVPPQGLGQFLFDVFQEIATSTKQQQFGLDKSQKLTTLCKRCEFKKLCNGGCPKHRFIPVENDPNLHNYLCPSYRYFFEKTMPYMQEMARSIR